MFTQDNIQTNVSWLIDIQQHVWIWNYYEKTFVQLKNWGTSFKLVNFSNCWFSRNVQSSQVSRESNFVIPYAKNTVAVKPPKQVAVLEHQQQFWGSRACKDSMNSFSSSFINTGVKYFAKKNKLFRRTSFRY